MNIARQLATIMCLAMVAHAMADDFTIADFSIKQGETKTVSIELNNTESSYIAFEFYMTLPEGISIPEDEDGYLMAELNASRINHHNLEVSRMPDGKYHFLCYSGQNNALKGTSGEIISLTVKAADDATEASGLEGLLFTQKLSDTSQKKVTFDDFTFHVAVTKAVEEGMCPHGCLLGDMNQDGMLTVTDVMLLVKIISTQ
ncbi:MAG: hypothetical protein J6Y97_08110 [Prevotella sp.]|nr:hypothetical protein [Prevotella sp.]